MIKNKVLINIVFLTALCLTTSISLCSFLINSKINKEITIQPTNIEVNIENQKFLNFGGITKKIATYEDDIVSDIFSVDFLFNQNEYLTTGNRQGFSTNSGLGAVIKFSSETLFNYVANNVNNEFINFSYNDYVLKMEKGINYTANNLSCLSFNELEKTCIFRISTSRDKANNNYYLQRIAEDNNLTDGKTIEGGQQKDNIWRFTMNFNLKILDSQLGYSTLFGKQDLSKIEIKLIFEDYR